MGRWGIIKANFGSIFVQPKLQAAIDAGDTDTATNLISKSIVTILRAGLTPRQRRNLDQLKENHRPEIQKLLSDAFQRGWVRDGVPNLSNAMDEVLLAASERIREGRARGECVQSERISFADAGRKRNAFFWFVAFLFISILIFRYTSGWWTAFGYVASFMSFGALLEVFKKREPA